MSTQLAKTTDALRSSPVACRSGVAASLLSTPRSSPLLLLLLLLLLPGAGGRTAGATLLIARHCKTSQRAHIPGIVHVQPLQAHSHCS